ncbi:MAG: TolC family protein [Elusimicrobia bacterium]|nr:TolC family protein [Elusimicrobiota bacterium]
MKRALGSLVLLAAAATAAEPRSLADIAREAVERAPALRAAQSAIDMARRARSEARAQAYPRLDAGSAFTRGDGPVYAFASLLDQRDFGPGNFAIGTLNRPGYVSNIKSFLRAGMPLFTGFEMQTARRLAGLAVTQAEVQARGVRDEIRRRVLEAGLAALHGRALAAALADRIKASEEEVAGAQRLRARGLVLGSDYFAAEAVLSGLKAGRVQAEKMAQGAEESLGILLGHNAPAPVRGTLRSSGPALPTAERLWGHARDHRADLAAARLDAEMAGKSVDRARASLFPTLDAMAEAQTNTADFSSNPSQRLLMLRAQWALGDPSAAARRAKARFGAEAAEERRAALEEQARVEILQSVRAHEGAGEALPLLDATVDHAARSLEAFRPLYREGRQSLLDVLRAEEALARAHSARLETLAQWHLNRVRALAAAGALDEGALTALSDSLEK